ncbi:hypothetical protein LAZ29_01465 [Cereibacter sphaeroides]|nr:hypothetical protein [Cereibacter sphaeroides]
MAHEARRQEGRTPDILVTKGKDRGTSSLTFRSRGLMGHRTPDPDRPAKVWMLLGDGCGVSLRDERSLFITRRSVYRSGLSNVDARAGMNGKIVGIAPARRNQGYATRGRVPHASSPRLDCP